MRNNKKNICRNLHNKNLQNLRKGEPLSSYRIGKVQLMRIKFVTILNLQYAYK